MPEIGGARCPVAHFEKYISLLNPNSDRLWQFPVDTFLSTDKCWFQNKPMGVNTLMNFMSRLSLQANLSQKYTNHSVRATAITLLADANFSPIDIMSSSTHKSIASLTPYQKTSLKRKIEMGGAIANVVQPQKEKHTVSKRTPGPSSTVTSETQHSVQTSSTAIENVVQTQKHTVSKRTPGPSSTVTSETQHTVQTTSTATVTSQNDTNLNHGDSNTEASGENIELDGYEAFFDHWEPASTDEQRRADLKSKMPSLFMNSTVNISGNVNIVYNFHSNKH